MKSYIFSYFCLLIFRFDAIVSADAFENLKPAPDIFLAASKILGVDPNEVIFLVPMAYFKEWSWKVQACSL